MGILLTLTGPSGAGKTTVAHELVRTLPGARMVRSLTTRKRRASDIPGEYRRISPKMLAAMRERDELLWSVEHGGNGYATERREVLKALAGQNAVGIMILVPDVLLQLESFLTGLCVGRCRTSVYLLPPDEGELVRRLCKGRRNVAEVLSRQAAEAEWERWAHDSGFDIHFVRNDRSLAITMARIHALLPRGA